MNIFKSPEQYAMLLIDAAEGMGFVAFDLLQDARTLYRMPDQYYRDTLAHISKYVLNMPMDAIEPGVDMFGDGPSKLVE